MRYLTVLASSLLFIGCAFASHAPPPLAETGVDPGGDVTTYPEPEAPADPRLAPTHALRIEDAWLGGEMIDIGTFEGDAYEVDYPSYATGGRIELHAGARGGDDFGWAMLRLTTRAVDGFEDAELSGDTSGSDRMSAVVCVGPEHGSYTFDETTSEVETTVEPGPTPQSRLFHFRVSCPTQGFIEGGFTMHFVGYDAEESAHASPSPAGASLSGSYP